VASIVAIHGLYETGTETWQDPTTKSIWMRDLFPHEELRTRILCYNYDATALRSPGSGHADRLLSYATNLIAELCAERQLTKSSKRPIIFICHDFGGLLLKRALVYSSTKSAKSIEHLHSIFDSTYGIVFLGTPHTGIEKEALFLAQPDEGSGPSQFLLNLLKGSEFLQDLTDQFAPLMKRYSIYNFWEQLATKKGEFHACVVTEESAAPVWENVEKCGVLKDHAGLAKYQGNDDAGYRVVLEVLVRYVKHSPAIIKLRWESAQRLTKIERQREAQDLLKPQRQDSGSDDETQAHENAWYVVPRSSSNYFTGRAMQAKLVKKKFSYTQGQSKREENQIFVIYGLGGSGKTQFCLRYAEENRSR
jgi:hypothetical protein